MSIVQIAVHAVCQLHTGGIVYHLGGMHIVSLTENAVGAGATICFVGNAVRHFQGTAVLHRVVGHRERRQAFQAHPVKVNIGSQEHIGVLCRRCHVIACGLVKMIIVLVKEIIERHKSQALQSLLCAVTIHIGSQGRFVAVPHSGIIRFDLFIGPAGIVGIVHTVVIKHCHMSKCVMSGSNFIFHHSLRITKRLDRSIIMILGPSGMTLDAGLPFIQARTTHGEVQNPNLFAGKLVPLIAKSTAFTGGTHALSGESIQMLLIGNIHGITAAILTTRTHCRTVAKAALAGGNGIGPVAAVHLACLAQHGLTDSAAVTCAHGVAGNHKHRDGGRCYCHLMGHRAHLQICSTDTGRNDLPIFINNNMLVLGSRTHLTGCNLLVRNGHIASCIAHQARQILAIVVLQRQILCFRLNQLGCTVDRT